jgi:hypothetical protein
LANRNRFGIAGVPWRDETFTSGEYLATPFRQYNSIPQLQSPINVNPVDGKRQDSLCTQEVNLFICEHLGQIPILINVHRLREPLSSSPGDLLGFAVQVGCLGDLPVVACDRGLGDMSGTDLISEKWRFVSHIVWSHSTGVRQ